MAVDELNFRRRHAECQRCFDEAAGVLHSCMARLQRFAADFNGREDYGEYAAPGLAARLGMAQRTLAAAANQLAVLRPPRPVFRPRPPAKAKAAPAKPAKKPAPKATK